MTTGRRSPAGELLLRGLLMTTSSVSQGGQSSSPYAGDLSANEAWSRLAQDSGAQLVDVRTKAEWTFVGIPDLSALSRAAIFCEWQLFPGPGQNPAFTTEAGEALARAGHQKNAPIFFLCRSGERSRAAAIAMTAAGYGQCFNISDGFEGGLDDQRHRGVTEGWKAKGLPRIQS